MTGPTAVLDRGQLVLPTDTPWCQRSEPGRVHSWRHRSDGGFDAASYEAVRVDEATARSFVLDRHYSGTYPAGRLQYGLYEVSGQTPEVVVGVAVLSVPMNVKVLTGPFPQLEPYTESVELGRFVLADHVPGNGESWFIGRIAEMAAADGVRGIVAFSDPFGRTTLDGSAVFPGHVGTIYQAANFAYCGPTRLRTSPTAGVVPHGPWRCCLTGRCCRRGHCPRSAAASRATCMSSGNSSRTGPSPAPTGRPAPSGSPAHCAKPASGRCGTAATTGTAWPSAHVAAVPAARCLPCPTPRNRPPPAPARYLPGRPARADPQRTEKAPSPDLKRTRSRAWTCVLNP
ncbi:Mom family adenine methylcarbamoylation protein [Actinomadura sp. 3N407]|uniref:Mom family adenine methylcarbamoylation protein n=1 Tax=Actinomadura sp. 3N407 TaxID=3457423 RepID=UPI003FCEE5D2